MRDVPRFARLAAGALAIVLAQGTRVFALNPALDISQYGHTAWRVSDGVFENGLSDIVQTPDGYLWLATQNGLWRFDGVKAAPWQPPSGVSLPSVRVTALQVTRDGALWISTDRGLARWHDKRLTTYPALAGHTVGRVVEDRQASLWLTTFSSSNGRRMCRITKDDVDCGGADGITGRDVYTAYEDRQGSVWAGSAEGLWRLTPGPPVLFRLPRVPEGLARLFEDDRGGLLFPDRGVIRRFIDGRTEVAYSLPESMRQLEPTSIVRDRDGGLWFGASSGGLARLHNGRFDVFTQSDGLSADSVTGVIEDREGNIWVVTYGGLDRFRQTAVAAFSTRQGFSNPRITSVAAAADGSVWVSTSSGVNRWRDGRVTAFPRRQGADDWAAGAVSAIFEDRAGRIWFGAADGLGYVSGDRLMRVPALPSGVMRGVGEDRQGNLWFAHPATGLHRLASGTNAIDRIPWAAMNRKDPPSAMVIDRATNGAWFGFSDGGLVLFRDGGVAASYDTAAGLAGGRVRHLAWDRTGALWTAADGGLSRLKDGRLATLTMRNGLPCEGVLWLVEDDSAAVWLGTMCGLVRLAREDIDRWWTASATTSGPPHLIRTSHFDNADGFRNYGFFSYTEPAVKSRDGRLWFLQPNGIGVLDPQRLPRNSRPPPVVIEQIIANRVAYDAGLNGSNRIHLPPLIRDLQIDYTALSLVAPEKMRFRYWLEGRDSEWQDVGTRRQAFYTDLAPGPYRFRVIASNNDGVWNEAGATIDFAIAPAYYQTTWFMALSAVTVIGLAWSAHRLRLRIVEKHEREITALNERLMRAQEQERIRIAGELHDGVMQEMLAMTMMLGATKRKLPEGLDARAAIDKVQDKMVQVGADIRQLSHDLHPPVLQDLGLPQALRAHCAQFSASCGVPIVCDADDATQALSRGAALALFRIVQEALGNAAKHAQARHIRVQLQRHGATVLLRIADDGVGFDRGQLTQSGGLGLVTMRERATQLNGQFEFDSVPGHGTTITVTIPFR